LTAKHAEIAEKFSKFFSAVSPVSAVGVGWD
jgi:hypothetical protein